MLLVALVMIPKILITANTCSVARVSIINQYRYPLSRLSSLTLSFKLEFHALLGDCSRIIDTLLLVIMVVTIVVMVTSFVDGKRNQLLEGNPSEDASSVYIPEQIFRNVHTDR